MEAIIESLNNHIKNKRKELKVDYDSYLVLQKIIKPNEKFPIYKEYEYIIWNVYSKTKDKIFDVKHTEKIADGKDENMIRYLRVKLIESVLNWMHSDSYNKVVYGK